MGHWGQVGDPFNVGVIRLLAPSPWPVRAHIAAARSSGVVVAIRTVTRRRELHEAPGRAHRALG